MSGTSLDGVDVAIVDFSEFPPRVLHCQTTAYPQTTRQALLSLCRSQSTTLDALYSLDAELGEIYAASVNESLVTAGIDSTQVIAVGCHGQTIRHSPDTATPYTAQIGDPNRLAALCGITTVADFRRKDIALGGQAAPLAPAYHQFLFRSETENRVVINIGGIANITLLPADPKAPLLGFDTGPGNTLLDFWSEQNLGKSFDNNGDWARSGRVIDSLLNQILTSEPYFVLTAPKSTGTEYFNPNWLTAFLADDHAAENVQATLVELTAITLNEAIRGLPAMPANCYICGGGAHNRYLLERFAMALPECGVQTTDSLGLNPDYVEAAAFAWLARERINQRGGNIPEVTHARHAAVLGGVYAAE
ncbi:MAG: anhydro-N-acetylmuramic acid kinase [Gammaproteobacteria bacterium]|nr:anhydro-N-acetylmuramic acid kinase [Gammaproteobacteria bacterium]